MGYTTIIGLLDGLRPEPRITVSEWADQFRKLDNKAAAEPGPYRTARTPYWKEPMDTLSITNSTRKVVIMKGAQVGATEIGLNFMGYVIHISPGPFLGVMPTDETMKRNSKLRIAPMIEATPVLRQRIKPSRAKDSGNTINQKEFPGGALYLAGANSGAGLRSMPARFLMLDEVDAYPMDVEGEGSPISLAEKRTSTFPNRKILEISTPTIDGQSIIQNDFLQTDQRYYNVPCPHCGAAQVLNFANLKWQKGAYENVTYECSHCQEQISETFKTQMLAAGKWIPTKPENTNIFVCGYHLSALYAPVPWKTWGEIAEEWDKSQGDENKIKTFYNTVLGETWKEKTEAPEWTILLERSEDYQPNTPFSEVAFITAGIDVQNDRIEIEIVGWIKGKKSQHIDYRVITGDTSKSEVWKELDNIVFETWERQDGKELSIKLIAIDSGYNTSKVYEWSQKHTFSKVIPIKGNDKIDTYFSPPRAIDTTKHGKKIGKQKVWHVGTNFIKNEIYGFLRLSKDYENNSIPDGYCFFPKKDAHYFKGLTAEVIRLHRNSRGYIKNTWVKIYERNEPLDCRVYARAAASVVGMDRWSENRWNLEAQNHNTKPNGQKNKPPQEIKKQERPTKIKSSFWDR